MLFFLAHQIGHLKYFEVALLLDNKNKECPAQYKEFEEISVRRKIEKDKVLNIILMIRRKS